MAATEHPTELVGREPQLARMAAILGRLEEGEPATVLVTGEAGIGKTTLVHAAAAEAGQHGALVAWGTCVDVAGAPGFWPWSQALEALVRQIGINEARRAAGEDAGRLASIVPALGSPAAGEASARDRLLLMDATARFLDEVAESRPVVIVLDDLQWADESSVALFDFIARTHRQQPLALIAAYRHDELSPAAHARVAELVSRAEHVQLTGLDAASVATLVTRVTGEDIDARASAAIHSRTGGHPFFVRELALLAGSDDEGGAVPGAVRDAIERRIARLPSEVVEVLEILALLGTAVRPQVAAEALGSRVVDVEGAATVAVRAGVLARRDAGIVFAHDLLRETVDEAVTGDRRRLLHRAIGTALEDHHARGADVAPSDIARHFLASIAVDGPGRATAWALVAARADLGALAFGEAAGHLRRLRAALAEAAAALDHDQLADVLMAEADAHARAGNTLEARGLLHHAADIADRAGDAVRVAQVALATAALGSQFSARRDDIVRHLDRARALVDGVDEVWEARLAATLARELQHSVPEDRARAGPLSEHALDVGRGAGDDATLLTCLLARHDVLWTPGAGAERAALAREIVAVAATLGDDERQAEGQLLLANALLEQGSPAFETPLESCLKILAARGQPHHRYTVTTRRACIALLRGDLEEAEALIDEATTLGERIREPDTGNVRMSQRLELVRARARPDELREFAAEAVAHWTGAPVHAHGVAAGFLARAGDLDAARLHVQVVLDLGTWRVDRSYLWSVFVRELAYAAVAVDDQQLAGQLFEDVVPIADSCGVNGAVVAFAGSHAHTASLLADAIGDDSLAHTLRGGAAASYRRLGASGWLAELDVADDALAGALRPAKAASMRRRDALWQVSFAGRESVVPHSKGLADIARLLATPDTDIHVLELIDAVDRSGDAGTIVDRRSLMAYRQRLADLDDDIDDAEHNHDPERAALAGAEREAILDELARITGTAGKPRAFSNHPAERARKAVSARIRDAMRKLEPVLPDLADHLHRSIVTGNYCRYRTDGTSWHIEDND